MLLYRKTFFSFFALLMCMIHSPLVSQENQLAQNKSQKIELPKEDSIYKTWTKNALRLIIICIASKYIGKENTYFQMPLTFLKIIYSLGLSINTFAILNDCTDYIFKKI